MRRWTLFLSALAFVALATPAAAQQGDMPADTAGVEAPGAAEETPDTQADETPDDQAPETPDEPVAEGTATHDWEFALAPTGKGTGAAGLVKVTEGESENTFVLDVTTVPLIDALDEPEKDVSAYTVWIVPGKDRIAESTLAGVLTVDADGKGTFQGTTTHDTFGLIVAATPNGAPASIGEANATGFLVLTGIPVAEAPDQTPAAGEAVTPAPAETPGVKPPAPPVTPDAPPTPQEGEVEVEPPAGEVEPETPNR